MPSLEDPELIGGRYRIVGPLGSGNMGDVHRAVHAVTGQKVALKILRAHVAQGHGGIKRFLREVQAAATIDHPGVVAVYDAGTHDDTLYIAMELLHGQGMGDKLKGDWPRAKAVAAMRALLEPLAVAHEAGIIHRDLKPDNVFIAQGKDGEEVVKLLDFGIAADQTNLGATQTGLTIGTPYYMSPEQAMDPRTCTGAADVWSFGV
ncbi:MAG: serine/threonine protein kinase, partial [Myxococcales bacterium]|nr:serine/threonine protein kinase [Myxococcales bacterium]